MSTDNAPPEIESCHTGTSILAVSGSQPEPPRQRPIPTVTPRVRGMLAAALALGLSQREAEGWTRVSRASISRLLTLDPTFQELVDRLSSLALVHPLLRIQQTAGKSWRAANWLRDYLDGLDGKMPSDELLGEFARQTRRIRTVLYESQRIAEEGARRSRI